MNPKEKLLFDIGIASFVEVELAEYLDTHPNDQKAMEYYNHYTRLKKQMTKDFSAKYYPLTMDLAEGITEWKWGSAPLPWEGVCG